MGIFTALWLLFLLLLSYSTRGVCMYLFARVSGSTGPPGVYGDVYIYVLYCTYCGMDDRGASFLGTIHRREQNVDGACVGANLLSIQFAGLSPANSNKSSSHNWRSECEVSIPAVAVTSLVRRGQIAGVTAITVRTLQVSLRDLPDWRGSVRDRRRGFVPGYLSGIDLSRGHDCLVSDHSCINVVLLVVGGLKRYHSRYLQFTKISDCATILKLDISERK